MWTTISSSQLKKRSYKHLLVHLNENNNLLINFLKFIVKFIIYIIININSVIFEAD